MVKIIILDIDHDYKKECETKIAQLKGNYEVRMVDSKKMSDVGDTTPEVREENDAFRREQEEGRNSVLVIVDSGSAVKRWPEYPVLGIEHRGRVEGAPYVSISIEDVDDEYLQMVYCRFHHIPLTIGENEHLILRESTQDDVLAFGKLYKDEEYVRYIQSFDSPEEESRKMKSYIQYMYGFYGYGLWTVVHKQSGDVIGRVGIENCEINGREYQELGYFIGKEYAGKGYAYEACGMVLQWAKDHDMNSLVVRLDKNNLPSLALAKKLGFVPASLGGHRDGSADSMVLIKYI